MFLQVDSGDEKNSPFLWSFLLTLFNLPGTIFVFAGILLSLLQDDFGPVSSYSVIIFGILTVISLFIDNLTMFFLGRKFGASKWGILGAIFGSLVGTVLAGIIGLLLGALIGASLLEFYFGRKTKSDAFKSGWGSFLGLLMGMGLKVGLCIGMFMGWLYLLFKV